MRTIIHIDLDAFYASVEMLLDPTLRGQPLIVAMGNPEGRGVVSTASYEAQRFGVHSAMPLRQALRLCPQARVVPVRHEVYAEHSRRVMDLLREYTPRLEQVSIDEAYLELDPGQPPEPPAREMQRRIKEELGLDCTLGAASNKLVAKVACNTVKPRGLIIVPPGTEKEFLANLPVERIPGAGFVTCQKLARWNVQTIGDLAGVPPEELRAEFGKHGVYLYEAAQGRDDSPLTLDAPPRSVSQENTFDRDTRDEAFLRRELSGMSVGVARELEREGYAARTIVLKLRYADWTTITRQRTLPAPTCEPERVEAVALELLETERDPRKAVRLIGVGVHNLVPLNGEWQLELDLFKH